MSDEEVLAQLRKIFAELFELEPERITPASTIFEELDLDSIDAIDLVARLQQLTGKRIDEAAMREVRTVADLISIVRAQLDGQQPSGAAAAG